MFSQKKFLVSGIGMLFLAGSLILFASCSEKKAAVTSGVLAPQLDVRDSLGQAMDISQLEGKVVFVNFWASWCPPCKEEMPSIEALHR